MYIDAFSENMCENLWIAVECMIYFVMICEDCIWQLMLN